MTLGLANSIAKFLVFSFGILFVFQGTLRQGGNIWGPSTRSGRATKQLIKVLMNGMKYVPG